MSKKSKHFWLSVAAVIMAASFVVWYLYVSFFAEESQAFQPEQISRINVPFQVQGTVSIVSPEGKQLFNGEIEVADTDLKREQGLMYRDSLGRYRGMLFVFPQESMQTFWMRNTRIALDIIYINADQVVVSIAENARPYDETSRPSLAPAQYVLEINGGLCAELGIQAGDKVSWTINEK